MSTQPGPTDPLAIQRDRIKAMSAEEKVHLAQALWEEAWRVAAAGVRARHPDWTEDLIRTRVRELMRDAGP